ncbi:phage tail protein [Roseivirga sp. BDSF3-8]|uniref:phage tail protein n=1 Tax=Roseivirga sp. BDSF3-8 TaxID=3241598 RepID=UPI003531E53B
MPGYIPPVGFRFDVRVVDKLEAAFTASASMGITDDVDGSFQDVAGISVEYPTESYQAGGENRYVYQLPQPAKYSKLVLKRGLVTDFSNLSDWCQETFESNLGKILTKTLVVSLLGESGMPVMVWYFTNAYPVKWEASNFNSMDNKIVVETLEVVYQRFESISMDNALTGAVGSMSSGLGF